MESPIPSACCVHTLPQILGQEGKTLEEGPKAPSSSDVHSRMVLPFVKETGLQGCRNRSGKEGPQCKMSLFATQIMLDRKDFPHRMEAPFAGWSWRSNWGPSQLRLLSAQSVMQPPGTTAKERQTLLGWLTS